MAKHLKCKYSKASNSMFDGNRYIICTLPNSEVKPNEVSPTLIRIDSRGFSHSSDNSQCTEGIALQMYQRHCIEPAVYFLIKLAQAETGTPDL